MDWILQRRRTRPGWTAGDLDVGGVYACYTIEDELREVKVYGETAIAAGRYRLVFVDSPKFGPDTISVEGVPGFTAIRIHGGMSDKDSLGCVIVGDQLDEAAGKISGAKVRGVLDKLKQVMRGALVNGEEVWLEVRNAPGDHFVDTGNAATTA